MYGHRRRWYWFLYFLYHFIYYSYYDFWVRLNVEWNIMLYIWKRKLFFDFFNSFGNIGLVIYWYCPLSLLFSLMWIKRKITIPENVITTNYLESVLVIKVEGLFKIFDSSKRVHDFEIWKIMDSAGFH